MIFELIFNNDEEEKVNTMSSRKYFIILLIPLIGIIIILLASKPIDLFLNTEVSEKIVGVAHYTVKNEEKSIRIVVDELEGTIIKEFNGFNMADKIISYSVQLENGDIRLIVCDNNTKMTYKGDWINMLIKEMEPQEVDGIKIRGVGMNAKIPTNRYTIKIEGKDSAKGTINIKWAEE